MNITGLNSYEISNYKSISDSGEIDLNSTAIILGANSAGKTNIVEPLLLLKQSIESSKLNLTLNGSELKLGRFEDIVHNQNTDNKIGYKFNFNHENEPEDDERPLECPICEKSYKEEGWYTKHIREKHQHFWERSGDELEKYENHPESMPYLEISYGYDDETGSNYINHLKFGNPIPVGSLYLSEIKLDFSRSSIQLSAKDLGDNTVIKLASSSDDNSSLNFQRITDVPRISNILLGSLNSSSNRRRFLTYTQNQPYISDQYMPNVYKYREKIQKQFENSEDSSDEEPITADSGEKISNILNGLLTRLATSIERSAIMIDSISSLGTNTTHVGPLRRSPQRTYSASGANSDEQYFRGVNIEQRLLGGPDGEKSPILERTNEWLNETGFDCKLDIDQVDVGDIFQLNVIENGMSVNVADSGFGLSQSLPILIECINMSLEKETNNTRRLSSRYSRINEHYITIIEEPEIHLNPKIESRLADFFLDIHDDNMGILIETHSEHLVNRVQRRIAEGSVKSENITVYFVEKDANSTDVREIDMDENGAFNEWPSDFFQEDLDDAIEMLKHSRGEQ